MSYSWWGHKELDTTDTFPLSLFRGVEYVLIT